MSAANNIPQGHEWMPVWYIDSMMFVPHYTKKGVWVLPGGGERTARELTRAGCKESTTYLWPRSWCNEKDKR
jgi:hypothetical protein